MNPSESGRIISFPKKEVSDEQRVIMVTDSADGTRKTMADELVF
jgi:hypothetical protein